MRAPSTSKNPKMRVTLLLLCNITSICCLKKRLGSLHFKIYEIINTLVYSGAYKRQTLRKKSWPLLLLSFCLGVCHRKEILAFIIILHVWWRFLAFFLCSFVFFSPVSYFTTICRQTLASIPFTNLWNGCLGKALKYQDKEKKNISLRNEDGEEENTVGQDEGVDRQKDKW